MQAGRGILGARPEEPAFLRGSPESIKVKHLYWLNAIAIYVGSSLVSDPVSGRSLARRAFLPPIAAWPEGQQLRG